MAVGCSHGEFIDPAAEAGVLEFRRRWKPHVLVHLGDAWDFACLRTGARGASEDVDRGRPLDPDANRAVDFLGKLEPTHFLFGNHEIRVVELAAHWCARTAALARRVLDEMVSTLRGLHCAYRDTWDMRTHYTFGGYKFLHGTLFGAYYLRDTARALGNCVIAHAHRPGIAPAERDDMARAYSPGCLRSIESAGYARARASTLAWGHGVVWGEFDDKSAQLWLHQPNPAEATRWRTFPV